MSYDYGNVVIPAPYQVRDKLQQESRGKKLDSVSSLPVGRQARNDVIADII
ncbi:MAG: hypothetical protein V3R54_07115 [Thermodesulfovibrionia bacterium]